jgi:hypothetical protein
LYGGYSTTLVKAFYLLRRGLRDLELLCHPLPGGVARPLSRRSQASLQASRGGLAPEEHEASPGG